MLTHVSHDVLLHRRHLFALSCVFCPFISDISSLHIKSHTDFTDRICKSVLIIFPAVLMILSPAIIIQFDLDFLTFDICHFNHTTEYCKQQGAVSITQLTLDKLS